MALATENWCRMGQRWLRDRQAGKSDPVSVSTWISFSPRFTYVPLQVVRSVSHGALLSNEGDAWGCQVASGSRLHYARDKIWSKVTGASSRSVVVTPLGVDVK